MGDWKTFEDKIKEPLKSKNLSAAKEELATGLEKFPNQINLLVIATDIYRASGDRKKSLEYSELLITHHPDNWNGYGRAAQDLLALMQFAEAKEKIQAGLEKLPNQLNLLTIATDVYRASGDREKSLEYSELLITHHPGNWNGYGRAAQDKLSLGRFEPGEHQKQMERCQPPKSAKQLTFWNQICNYKKTTMVNIWTNSYKLPPQATDFERATILDSWQPFQYWSQGSPPHQIKKITEYWNEIFRSIGVKTIKVFDKLSALDYIKKNHPEISRSFETSFHYAVEADVFRVAFAQKNDCIWLDSDLYPKRETANYLKTLLSSRKTTLFCRWFKPWITNAFFITPSSSLFFENILTSTAGTDFSTLPHTQKTIFDTFGPGRYNQEIENIINRFYQVNGASPITKYRELEHFNFVNDHNFASMGPPFKLTYKSTKDAWQKAIPLQDY